MKNMRKIRAKTVAKPTGRRGVIYVRVSSTDQIAGTSLDEQERQAREYCAKHHIEVASMFREEGVSAKTADRPSLIEAMEYCRSNRGKVTDFVVWKVDRLARNAGDHFMIRGQLQNNGIRLNSVTEQIGDDPMNKLAETIYAAFAEFDNEVRKKRAVDGMRARLRDGIWPFKAPVGYRNRSLRRQGIKKTGPDPVDPDVFPILQRMLKGFAREVYSITDIVKELEKANFHELSGTKPTQQWVDHVLQPEQLYFYAGILRDAFDDEYTLYPGKHEPMITMEEMNMINEVRKKGSQSRVSRVRNNPTFPLRRVALCSTCGHALTGSSPKGRNGHYAYYHCFNKECPMRNKAIPKADIETKFMELASGMHVTDQFMAVLAESLVAYQEEQEGIQGKAEVVHKTNLEALRAKRARIFEMAENGAYKPEEVRERMEVVDGEIGRLELTLAGMEAKERLDVKTATDKAQKVISGILGKILELDPSVSGRFQKVAFPSGIPFTKGEGFGTVKTARVFTLNRTFATTGSLEVRRVGFEPT